MSSKNYQKVSLPAIQSAKVRTSKPKITQTKDGCTVSHREFISLVETTAYETTFTDDLYIEINPGSAKAFPWLSGIANSWETYRFSKLRYTFVPRLGTGVPGQVMMAPDQDVLDAPYKDSASMLAASNSVSGPVWSDLVVDWDISGVTPQWKYVRSSEKTGDQKLYDLGSLQVADDGLGLTSPAAIGYLWADYVVRFRTPQPPYRPMATSTLTRSLYETSQPLAPSSTLNRIAFNTLIPNALKAVVNAAGNALKISPELNTLVTAALQLEGTGAGVPIDAVARIMGGVGGAETLATQNLTIGGIAGIIPNATMNFSGFQVASSSEDDSADLSIEIDNLDATNVLNVFRSTVNVASV